MPTPQVWAPWLAALGIAVTGCGDGSAPNSAGKSSSAGNNSSAGSGNGDNSSSAGNNSGAQSGSGGGAPVGCSWVGTSWSCGSSSLPSGALSSGGAPTGNGSGGTAATPGGGGATPSAGGATGNAGATSVGDGPSISIMEFLIPTASNPGEIVAGPDGNLWFNNETTSPSGITRMTPAGVFTHFSPSVTGIGPVGIAAGSDGNVWYAKQQGVGLITPDGKITERDVPGGRDSAYMTKGPGGNVWFTEPIANRVASVSPAGMFNEHIIPTPNGGPFGITTGPDGNLWFTEQSANGNKIGRVTPTGTFTEFPIPTPASNPFGITSGSDGNLWFTEQDGHKIGRITPAGVITEFVVPSGGSPGAITSGPDGNVWFVEYRDNAIGRATPTGAIAEYSIPTPRSVPTGICVGPDKNVYFTELDGNKVGRVSNLSGGGNIAPGLKPDDTSSTGMAKPCTDDSNCIDSGNACGGDVCSAMTHTCVAATSQDPGSCSTTAKCWCAGQGATCDATAHHCSFTTFGAR
jgi:streptogramin lyase